MKQGRSAYNLKALSGHALGRLVVELTTPKKKATQSQERSICRRSLQSAVSQGIGKNEELL